MDPTRFFNPGLGFCLASVLVSLALEASPPLAGSLAPLNPEFLAWQEAQAAGTARPRGWVPAPADTAYLGGPMAPVRGEGGGTSFPATYDLRTLNRVTPPRDENGFGIPWACSALASLESSLLTQGLGTAHLSDWHLAWFTYNAFSPTLVAFDNPLSGPVQDIAGGTSFQSEAILERGTGAVDASLCPTPSAYPYPAAEDPTGTEPVSVRLQQTLYLGSTPAPSDLKTAIMTYGATSVRLFVDTTLGSLAGTSGYYYTGQQSGHMVTLVGWDDAFPAASCGPQTPPHNGAWLAANCWGTYWADGGYFRISYDTPLYDGMVFLAGTLNYDQIYQYDPLGHVGAYGFGSTAATFANVFTAQAAQSIQAAAFYVNAPGASCQVSVRTGLTGDPGTGALAAGPVAATFTYPGYQTVALPVPVNVAQGETFALIVAVTTPGCTTPIPLQTPLGLWTSAATAKPGQGFALASGTWTDMTSLQANASICLKAFAGPPAPVLASFLPVSGVPGTQVTVTGSGFTGATAVAFNGLAAPDFTVVSDTVLTVAVPAGAASGPIAVASPYGTTGSLTAFTVVTLTGCAPSHGVPGLPLTLTGTGLSGATAVTLNGTACVILTLSDTQITTTVPPGASTGPLSVLCPQGTLTAPTDFEVLTFDLNGDGVVDVRDLATLAAHYGTLWVAADLAGDGTVGDSDLMLWLQAF